ncbi:MAG: two-component system response regulator CreB [Thermodesulfobacteriota bacterium]
MGETILVVEDESSIAENIMYALSTEGYDPLWCETGQDALAELTKKEVSLIVLDVGLPDINGFDVLREIRKTRHIPVIFVTARADEVDRVVGLELGADDYVVKPFSPRELTARVRAVLRRTLNSLAHVEARQDYSSNPFELDEKRHSIMYHGKNLELSRYEFRLLRTLVLKPGQVYSREQLMDKVWEDPAMSFERTVDTHIKTIRQKLKAIKGDSESIITHRGVGYSLKEKR